MRFGKFYILTPVTLIFAIPVTDVFFSQPEATATSGAKSSDIQGTKNNDNAVINMDALMIINIFASNFLFL
jgi:hypothetical protein